MQWRFRLTPTYLLVIITRVVRNCLFCLRRPVLAALSDNDIQSKLCSAWEQNKQFTIDMFMKLQSSNKFVLKSFCSRMLCNSSCRRWWGEKQVSKCDVSDSRRLKLTAVWICNVFMPCYSRYCFPAVLPEHKATQTASPSQHLPLAQHSTKTRRKAFSLAENQKQGTEHHNLEVLIIIMKSEKCLYIDVLENQNGCKKLIYWCCTRGRRSKFGGDRVAAVTCLASFLSFLVFFRSTSTAAIMKTWRWCSAQYQTLWRPSTTSHLLIGTAWSACVCWMKSLPTGIRWDILNVIVFASLLYRASLLRVGFKFILH